MQPTQKGFSLIELLVTCSIILFLLIFILPPQTSLLKKSTNQILSSQLLHAIHLARTEAIARRTLITLCGSKDKKTCSSDWINSYIIQAEQNSIYIFENTSKGVLHWRAFPHNKNILQFLPSGESVENGTYWYCEKGKISPSWSIAVNKAGRARLIYPNKKGKIHNAKGEPLLC